MARHLRRAVDQAHASARPHRCECTSAAETWRGYRRATVEGRAAIAYRGYHATRIAGPSLGCSDPVAPSLSCAQPSAALTRAGVNGNTRSRTPVALKNAL